MPSALRCTGAFYWPGDGLPPAWGKANGDLVLSAAAVDGAEGDAPTWRRGEPGEARGPYPATPRHTPDGLPEPHAPQPAWPGPSCRPPATPPARVVTVRVTATPPARE